MDLCQFLTTSSHLRANELKTMSSSFWFGTKISNLLFLGLDVDGGGQMLGMVVGIFSLAVVNEWIRASRTRLECRLRKAEKREMEEEEEPLLRSSSGSMRRRNNIREAEREAKRMTKWVI